jgi:hypothetical protein
MRSATIEVVDERERVLAVGRFGTDREGYKAMLATWRSFADRVGAVEGCNGVGRHLAQRLVADGEPVVDVPAKLSARARVFSTGQGRKSDPVDAHSVALVGLRSDGLRVIEVDDATVALRLLIDRRDELGVASSTPRWAPTPDESRRAREDTRGRHFNPARPTHTPPSALRISHFPDPPPASLEPPPSPRLDGEDGVMVAQPRQRHGRAGARQRHGRGRLLQPMRW